MAQTPKKKQLPKQPGEPLASAPREWPGTAAAAATEVEAPPSARRGRAATIATDAEPMPRGRQAAAASHTQLPSPAPHEWPNAPDSEPVRRGRKAAPASDIEPPPPARRGRAAAVAADTGALARQALDRAGFSDPALVLRWDEIAGTETARLARPLRLKDGPSGGVLTLMAEPGAAVFLQHETRPLCERINAFLGRPAVARLRFVQASLAQAPRRPLRPAPKAPVPAADPARKYDGPEGVREALLRLAQARRPNLNDRQD